MPGSASFAAVTSILASCFVACGTMAPKSTPGLATRFYLPKTDVRMDLLTPTATSSHCPYKGDANYWSLALDDGAVADVAWLYRTPLPESQKIAGLVCFYPERVDLYVDGRLQA